MKKRLMAVLLCVCMAAVLLTPYASVLTADGALRLGIAGGGERPGPDRGILLHSHGGRQSDRDG